MYYKVLSYNKYYIIDHNSNFGVDIEVFQSKILILNVSTCIWKYPPLQSGSTLGRTTYGLGLSGYYKSLRALSRLNHQQILCANFNFGYTKTKLRIKKCVIGTTTILLSSGSKMYCIKRNTTHQYLRQFLLVIHSSSYRY